MDVQVRCIRKPDRNSPHEHITHLGNGTQVWTREQVIQWIDRGEHSFFVADSRVRADVRVVREFGKVPFLRTVADGRWTDNLLSLPTCV
jgi:Protein of unknown function (DUF3892)